MKIVLLKDVRKVGQKGQVVEVAEGYGRNFLVKNGFAKVAIDSVLKEVENEKNIKKEGEKSLLENELKILEEKNKSKFYLKKQNDNGHLFASIKLKEISEISGIPGKNIILDEDIKSLGEFEIKVNLGGKKGRIFLVIE